MPSDEELDRRIQRMSERCSEKLKSSKMWEETIEVVRVLSRLSLEDISLAVMLLTKAVDYGFFGGTKKKVPAGTPLPAGIAALMEIMPVLCRLGFVDIHILVGLLADSVVGGMFGELKAEVFGDAGTPEDFAGGLGALVEEEKKKGGRV